MSFFKSLDTSGVETQQDSKVSNYSLLDSGLYAGTISVAYLDKANSGANSVNLILNIDTPTGDVEYKETFYITNKKGDMYYIGKKDNKKYPMMGYTQISELVGVTIKKQLVDLIIEDKILQVYDYEAKKNVPTKKEVLIELSGVPVTVLIKKQLENKQEKNEVGEYVNIAETKEVNNVVKFLIEATHLTFNESLLGAGTYADDWLAKYKGKVIDKSIKLANQTTTTLTTDVPERSSFKFGKKV